MNKLLLKLCFGVIFTCLYFVSPAQDPNGISVPKIIPPGPTSFEFQRFLGYSADGSTGTTNVAIPLYNLNLPGGEIPFSLRYNSSGIKVNQPAGIAGYGWSLFPGLRITRTIMGKSDNTWKTNNIQTMGIDNDYLAQISTLSGGEIEQGGIDGQYDLFTLHLPNYNGSFIVQWDGSAFHAVSIPATPLKIEPILPADFNFGFTVTDDNGIVYTFGGYGNTVEYTNGPGSDVTSWMLKSMTLPGVNNTVTFNYVESIREGTFAVPSRVVWDNYTTISDDFRAVAGPLGIPGGWTGGAYSYADVPGTYNQSPPELTISSVDFPGGHIAFNYQSLAGATGHLQNMIVTNSAQNIVKQINISVNSNTRVLESVAVSDGGVYSMQYRNPQPYFNIYDEDRWGYYNNKGNTTMIPEMTLPMLLTSPLAWNTTTTSNQYFAGANRDVDTAAMAVRSLQKIIYPTGGWSSFVYEPHTFLHNGATMYGGGLRIKEIDTYDPISNKTLTKTYAYGTGQNGLAKLDSYPEDDSFLDVRTLYAEAYDYSNSVYPIVGTGSCRRVTVNSQSRYRYFGLNTNIWYDQVTEYSNEGKIVYYYKYLTNPVQMISVAGHNLDFIEQVNSMVCPSPDLVTKETYKGVAGTYTLLQRDEYLYSAYLSAPPLYTAIWGLIVNPGATIAAAPANGVPQPANPLPPDNKYWTYAYFGYNQWFQYANPSPTPFLMASYIINTTPNQLLKTTSTDFRNNGPVAVETTYAYADGTTTYNKTSETTTSSDGGTLIDNYYYPTSVSIPNLNSMQQAAVTMLNSNNRLTTVVEKNTFKNGTTPISGVLSQYQDWGNNIIAPQSVFTQKSTGPFEARLQYNGYDNKGNVQSVSKANGPQTCYIYGYGGQYPIAKIDNADYATVRSVLGGQAAVESFRDNTSPADAVVSAFLAPLRTIAGASVTTYTYAPLVGMTSSTDAKGITTYYEYDNFQRLMNIKDKDGKILKHNEYHYHGQ